MSLINKIKEETREKLKENEKTILLLEEYSLFLEKHGYMDVDWRAEEPYAIVTFLKERNSNSG